jgi:hypothetical protein
MLTKEITNQIEENGVVRKIRITPKEVVIVTGSEEKTYQYTMYNRHKDMFSIVTNGMETVVFSIKWCKIIIFKTGFFSVEFYQIAKEAFIKLSDKNEQAIYDEKGNPLEKSTDCDLEIIFGGHRAMIKKTDKNTKESQCIEI